LQTATRWRLSAEVEFVGLPAGLTTGEVLREEPRVVEARDGRFGDWFGPSEAYVYRFALPKEEDGSRSPAPGD
jgi:hypothetical protein